MSQSFDFRELDFLTVGTLGPRGQREFFLQARSEGRLVSLKIEKQQVAALAEYLDRVLRELPEPEGEISDPPPDLDLREPVVAEWTVASLAIAYAQELDRLVVVAESFVDEEDDDPFQARFFLQRNEVTGLIGRARTIVAAGRPPCLYCGQPLETRNGDWCPCRN